MGNNKITKRKTITATVIRKSRFDFQAKATQKKDKARSGKAKAPKTCGT
jgi:hypothetical protein